MDVTVSERERVQRKGHQAGGSTIVVGQATRRRLTGNGEVCLLVLDQLLARVYERQEFRRHVSVEVE